MSNGDHFGAYGDPPSMDELRTRRAIERMDNEAAELRGLVLAARGMILRNLGLERDKYVIAMEKALKPYKGIV